MKVHPNKIKAVADAVKRVKNGGHAMRIVSTIVTVIMVMVIKIWVIKVWVGYGSSAESLGPSFEIGAKNWPRSDSQSESVLEIKTKTADKSAKLHENTRFEELVMELERNKKVLKELLFFDLGAEVLDRDQFGNEAAKISGVFSGFSK